MKFQSQVLQNWEAMVEKYNSLSSGDLDKVNECLDFVLVPGNYIGEFEKGISSKWNRDRKTKKVSALKKSKTGAVLGIELVKEFAIGTETSSYLTHCEQLLTQKILMDESADHFRAAEYTENANGRKVRVKGTGSINITPYGKAFVELAKVLGVEHIEKMVLAENQKQVIWTPIRKELTEAQKEAMAKGRATGKKGGKRGETSKVKKLRGEVAFYQTKFKEFKEMLENEDWREVIGAMEIFIGTFETPTPDGATDTEAEDTEAEATDTEELLAVPVPPVPAPRKSKSPSPAPRKKTPSPSPEPAEVPKMDVVNNLLVDTEGEDSDTIEITEEEYDEIQFFYEYGTMDSDGETQLYPDFDDFWGKTKHNGDAKFKKAYAENRGQLKKKMLKQWFSKMMKWKNNNSTVCPIEIRETTLNNMRIKYGAGEWGIADWSVAYSNSV
jgi:hypothetical protein